MVEGRIFENERLQGADLVVDAVYEGGDAKDFSAAVLPKLLKVGTSGGFRPKKSPRSSRGYSYIVLFTTLSEPTWPDHLNPESGIFTYYGDNREPGTTIHEKPGNKTLRTVFEALHTEERGRIPPLFVFASTGEGYNRRFVGLVVPGYQTGNQSDDLVALWKNKGGNRFQNYRARFTVLDVERVSREWIGELQRGEFLTDNAPEAWVEWVEDGKYTPLKAGRTRDHRTKVEQEPSSPLEERIRNVVYAHFEDEPSDFEYAAAAIFELMDGNVGEYDVTRESRDGGRDAMGQYNIGPSIGPTSDNIAIEFALEAKCHKPGSGNGVHDISRLISRLRYRQFGVFITTAHLAKQAYEEIKNDGHPVLVLSGGDIAKILVENGLKTETEVKQWLDNQVNS